MSQQVENESRKKKKQKNKTTVLEWVRSILGKVLSCLIFTEIYSDNKDLVKIQ